MRGGGCLLTKNDNSSCCWVTLNVQLMNSHFYNVLSHIGFTVETTAIHSVQGGSLNARYNDIVSFSI